MKRNNSSSNSNNNNSRRESKPNDLSASILCLCCICVCVCACVWGLSFVYTTPDLSYDIFVFLLYSRVHPTFAEPTLKISDITLSLFNLCECKLKFTTFSFDWSAKNIFAANVVVDFLSIFSFRFIAI